MSEKAGRWSCNIKA